MGNTEDLIMAKIEDVTIGMHVEYRIVFFPIATWREAGGISILTVLGIPVYRRVGDLVKIFGITMYETGGISTVSAKKPVLRKKESKHAS